MRFRQRQAPGRSFGAALDRHFDDRRLMRLQCLDERRAQLCRAFGTQRERPKAVRVFGKVRVHEL